jgi:zinc protease
LHGTFGHHDEKSLLNGEKGIFQMLFDIEKSLTAEELSTAKNTLEVEWAVLPFKTIHLSLMVLGEALDLGDWKDLSNRVETLKGINAQDIKHVIENYLTFDKSTAVRIYPTSGTLDQVPETQQLVTVTPTKANLISDRALKWSCKSRVEKKGNARLQTLETSSNDTFCSISLPYSHHDRYVAQATLSLMGQSVDWNGERLGVEEITSKMTDLGMSMEKNVGENQVHFSFVFSNMDKLDEAVSFASDGILKCSHFGHSKLKLLKETSAAELASLKDSQMYQTKRELVTRLFKNTKYEETIEQKISRNFEVNMDRVDSFYDKIVKHNENWNGTVVYPERVTVSNIIPTVLGTSKTAKRSDPTNEQENKWEALPREAAFKEMILPVASSTVFMGQTTSLAMYDKKNVALRLAVQALGGGMTGRLMSILRVKDGEKNGVYGVYASVYDQMHAPTYVVVNATFTPTLQQHGIDELKYEVNRWNEHSISQEELENSKREVLGKRALNMDDFETVSDIYHSHLLNNREPTEEWNSFNESVKAVTLEDVREAMALLDPDKWVVVCTSPLQYSPAWDEDTDED